VVITATPTQSTLYHFHYQKTFKAQNGAGGQGRQKTGKSGDDLIIEVPTGTLIYDHTENIQLRDITRTGESFVVAKGGRGGLGNTHFKSSTHRSPRFAQPGEPGESVTLRLELKLLADVGIIGLPNAGKSTLIRAMTSANPKTAPYPFTTLIPNLGVVQNVAGAPFVVADIPGLIEGAHKGAGLGIQFLKHIERTRVLIHLIDAFAVDPKDPLKGYRTVNDELRRYRESLVEKTQILVLNKIDLTGAAEMAEIFKTTVKARQIMLVSAATGQGVGELVSKLTQILDQNNVAR
jgi:GTP-binding protein